MREKYNFLAYKQQCPVLHLEHTTSTMKQGGGSLFSSVTEKLINIDKKVSRGQHRAILEATTLNI